MKAALLPDRGVVEIVGDTARTFLNGLVTADIGAVTPQRPAFAALLTPQGKIVVDFIVVEAPDGGFLLDCPAALAPTLVQKLNFYKLRAKVTVQDVTETLGVLALWDGRPTGTTGVCYADPRLAGLGHRAIIAPHDAATTATALGAALVEPEAYEAHRIALGVPRGGLDFIYGDAFPHETDMDQLAGVDFAKGCYVGQEVVSRMEHRGSARTRVVQVTYDGFAVESGTPVTAGDKTIGTLGSCAGGHGVALLRLDRLGDALTAGVPLVAGGVTLTPHRPPWARFAWPAGAEASSVS